MSMFASLCSAILKTDSYKVSHHLQTPPGLTLARNHMLPRGGPWDHYVWFGALQLFFQQVFGTPITKHDIDEAEELIVPHMGPVFPRKSWERVVDLHGGYIPLRIKHVPEGVILPIKTMCMGSESTDSALAWMPNYFESALYTWYAPTIATLSNDCRRTIMKYLELNGDPSTIDFKLHDFGYRGTTDPCEPWQAAIGGMAHLINFKGTDTIPALVAAKRFYLMNPAKPAGFSIPAAEHFTITSWGRDHEADAYANMLRTFPNGLVAVVSDSYNIYDACEKLWGELLKDMVLSRDGVLIIRPDSGDPVTVVLKCLDILGTKFGTTVNAKGKRVLHPKVRIIQGDGVDPLAIDRILFVMDLNGWSSDNIAFGMGGALLQKVNRDTMKWKVAVNQIIRDGHLLDIAKDPVTDPGKKSRGGNLTVYLTENGYVMDELKPESEAPGRDIMCVGYENGRIFTRESIYTIYDRVRIAEKVLAHRPALISNDAR